MHEKNIRVLVVYRRPMSFVRNDIKILSKHFKVRTVSFRSPLDIIRIIMGVMWADVCLAWFGNLWAAIAVIASKVLKKKIAVIAGGHDAAYDPEIGYGLMLHPILKHVAKFSFNYADLVIAVSNYTRKELLNHTNSKNIKVVYNGVDTTLFYPLGEKDPDLVVTIGIIKKSNLIRKGLLLFIESARFLPQKKFVVIGNIIDKSVNDLKKISPKNVEILGYLPHEKLLYYLQRAKVYVQASRYESFGVSVVESMLCSCVPVVSKRGGLPEVVGDMGVYLTNFDPKELAEKVNQATYMNLEKNVRKRALCLFSLKKREEALIKCLKDLITEQ